MRLSGGHHARQPPNTCIASGQLSSRYRILYTIDDVERAVLIVKIGQRGDIYR